MEDTFWSSTVGRIFSFVFIIIIFGFFSFVLKSCKNGGSASCLDEICDCLRHGLRTCQRGISYCVARCTNVFKSQTGGSESASTRAEAEFSRSRASEDDLSMSADIVTISLPQEQGGVAPNYSGLFASNGARRSSSGGASTEVDVRAPPPDYSSVWSASDPTPYPAAASEGAADSGGEVAPPPNYSSVRFPSSAPDSMHSSVPPPPPDDSSAPPSYELPEPPSYDSLFNRSSTA